MSLAAIVPLRPRATLTPVREAASAGGHWITLHAADSDEGTVHVFIGGNGRVTKGPSSLVGGHIGALSSHPSTKRVEHHPPGHEPHGARAHPQYTEHQPPSTEKPAPLPGKPYARLHGGAQTRQEQPKEGPEPLSEEQTHAGLQVAREQAKAARSASPEAKAADAAVAHQQAQADLAAYRASKDRNPNPWAPHLSPPVNDAKDRELQEKATRAQLAHQSVQAQQQQAAAAEQQEGQRAHDKEMVRLKASTTAAAQPKEKGTGAVDPLRAKPPSGSFHDLLETDEGRQRVADLAGHALDKGHARTFKDQLDLQHLKGFVPQMKNWGPSMDVARQSIHDAMDRARPALERAQGEVAEREGKERVAQQQAAGAQREKEFAAHAHQQRLSNPEPRQQAAMTTTPTPSPITKEHIQAKVMAGEHLTREEKGFVLNGYRMPKPKPEEPMQPAKSARQPAAEQPKPAAQRDFQAEARAKRAAAKAEQERTEAAKSPEQRASEREAAAQPQLRQHREALLRDRALSHYFDRDALASHGHMLDTAGGRAELRGHMQGILDRAHAGDSDKSVPAQRLRDRIDDLERHIGQHGAVAVRTAHEPALGALGQAKHILPGAAGQKPLAADATTGPVTHKPAQPGDPIQPERARPVGQLGLLGERKPFEAPKAKSEAEQAARGGQKSLFGSSFENPNERQPATPTVEHDEGHVQQIMQAHAAKDEAGRAAYRQQMQRIASGESYKPTMPDGQPLSRATAAEAARRMGQPAAAMPAPRQPEAPKATAPATEHPAIAALRNTAGYLRIKYLAPGVMRPSPESSQLIKQHHDPIITAAEAADPAHPLHRDPDLMQARAYMDQSAHKATEEYKAAQRAAPPQVPLPRDVGLPAGHMLVSPHGTHAITSTADRFHLINRETGEHLASHEDMAGIKRALAKVREKQKGAQQPQPQAAAQSKPATERPKAAAAAALTDEEQQQVARAVDRWTGAGPDTLREMAQRHQAAAGRGGENLTIAAHREAARRLHAQASSAPSSAKPEPTPTVRPAQPSAKPWDYVSPSEQKRRAGAKAEGEKKAAQDERARLEGAAIDHASSAHEAFTKERAQSHAAHLERLMGEHREKYGEDANRALQELVSTARSAGRRHAGERFASQSVHAEVEAARQRQQQRSREQKPASPTPARPSAATKQAALEHVNRELGDSDVHAPTHKDITQRLKSGDLPPEHAGAAVDAAYQVASTPPSDWDKFGDSLHHLHAQKALNADRLREMQQLLKEHQRTPKSKQMWPMHGERESRLAGSVESLKDRQARIEAAIARKRPATVRESEPAGPAARFVAPARTAAR